MSPWSIFARKNIRFLIMPAYFHNTKFNNDIFGYPGIIEYTPTAKGFHTINIIMSARKKTECVFTAGEPLLHVIPFEMPNSYKGAYGFADQNEKTFFENYHPKTVVPQFYRKFFLQKRKYNLEKRPEVIKVEKTFDLKNNE
jgi:hypothetical protein